MIRNREMPNRERIDCVVAAPGGSGTAGMIEIAESYDLPIHRITE